MRKITTILTVLLLLSLALMPAVAQDDEDEIEPHPLLEMLGFVPPSVIMTSSFLDLSYVDYRALEAASGIATPTDTDLTTSEGRDWIFHSRRLTTSPQFIQFVMMQLDDMREVVGFTVFDIDRALMFGQPPSNSIILGGDPDALTNADVLAEKFVARDFVAEEVNGAIMWQHSELDGMAVSIQDRNPAYPFGGHLGRNEPVAMIPGYLFNSPDIDSVRAMVNAASGQMPSLADSPEFIALVEAITQDGPLIQAHFFSPVDLGFQGMDLSAVLSGGEPVDHTEDYGTLPLYRMAVMADTQDEDGNIVHNAALVYADADNAQVAAEELAQRLTMQRLPLNADQTVLEMFDAEIESVVYESEAANRAVALARVRYAPPDDDQIPPGLMFSRWISAVFRREFFIFAIKD
jgi:hypothetical protein